MTQNKILCIHDVYRILLCIPMKKQTTRKQSKSIDNKITLDKNRDKEKTMFERFIDSDGDPDEAIKALKGLYKR